MTIDTAVLRATAGGRDDGVPGAPTSAAWRRGRPQAVYGVGLWVFIGVATTLFSLFISAYIMRLAEPDASAIPMPPQLWFSTLALVVASVLLQRAATAALAAPASDTRRTMLAAGACALAFFGAQAWAWDTLLAQQISAVGNPAGSFFYLLTSVHGVHVAGGLVGWAIAARATRRHTEPAAVAWRIALCARYWHFLLLAWLALFATFTWITPDVARIICRTA